MVRWQRWHRSSLQAWVLRQNEGKNEATTKNEGTTKAQISVAVMSHCTLMRQSCSCHVVCKKYFSRGRGVASQKSAKKAQGKPNHKPT
jgi:hypothetical protein